MTLTPTRTILDDAYAAGRGVGAFNVVHLETAECREAVRREAARLLTLFASAP